MKLGTKLLIAFLLVGIIPFTVVGITSLNNGSNALSKSAFNQLEGMRGVKMGQIQSFFEERKGDMGVLVQTVSTLQRESMNKLMAVRDIKKFQIENYFISLEDQLKIFKRIPAVRLAITDFNQAFEDAGDRVGTAEWNRLARAYDPLFKEVMEENG